MTKQKIFFSYSRVDGSAFALRLAVDLKKMGFNVWIDQQDIRAGLEWDTEIQKALINCDCLLFLETEKSVVSTHVLDEVYYALEQKKTVIPLIFVDSKTPFRLNRLQHVDFTKDYDTGFAMLVKELQTNPAPTTYTPQENIPGNIAQKSFFTKNLRALLIISSLILLIVVILLIQKNKPAATIEVNGAIIETVTDSTTLETDDSNHVPTGQARNDIDEESRKSKDNIPFENETRGRGVQSAVRSKDVNKKPADPIEDRTENKLSRLNETVAGDWQLVGIEPKAASQSGYLKIESLGENKAGIKSYMQFYYPDSKASSYLTVFNAFAGCSSCEVSKEMKLQVEDIAIGSRTIKKLQEDQADGRKAGEVIMDANANKSIRGTVTLQFADNNTAIIKVTQPVTISLANELMLQPFVYTFRFKKND